MLRLNRLDMMTSEDVLVMLKTKFISVKRNQVSRISATIGGWALCFAVSSLSHSIALAGKFSDPVGRDGASTKLLQMEANEGLYTANGTLSCIHSPVNSGSPCDLHFVDSGTGAEFQIVPHNDAFRLSSSGKTLVSLKGRLNSRGNLEIVRITKQ